MAEEFASSDARSGASRSLADAEVAKYPSPPGNREAPVETADDGRQVVGVDLHRRRSVLVRMTQDGRRLGMAKITNSPQALRTEIARAVAAGGARGDVWVVLGGGHPGGGGCRGAPGTPAGGEGVYVPAGQERREGRRGSGGFAADGAAAGCASARPHPGHSSAA